MDIQLYAAEKGTGDALILLHGNGEDGGYFEHQVRHFAGHYRTIAVDTRGHGRSPRGTAPFRIAQFAQDLKVFMDERGIEQAILLGFSDGANIAMRFALAWPERVRGLILNGGNLNTRGVKPHIQLPIELGWRAASLFAKKSPEAKRNAELLGLMVLDPDIRLQELSALQMPALVIAGSRDMIKTSHTRQIAAAIPGARLCILPGTHFIANKSPDAFNRAVEEFLHTAGLW